MFTKIFLSIACIIALPFGSGFAVPQDTTSSAAQSDTTQNDAPTGGTLSSIQSSGLLQSSGLPTTLGGSSSTRYFGLTSQQRATDKKVSEAARVLRQAKSTQERTEAEEALTTLLSEDYDSRLEGYEEYLKALEAKLVEMRKSLQKRREAKTDMIKLRIKVLEAEAEDLGWPARMSGSSLLRLQNNSQGNAIWSNLAK